MNESSPALDAADMESTQWRQFVLQQMRMWQKVALTALGVATTALGLAAACSLAH